MDLEMMINAFSDLMNDVLVPVIILALLLGSYVKLKLHFLIRCEHVLAEAIRKQMEKVSSLLSGYDKTPSYYIMVRTMLYNAKENFEQLQQLRYVFKSLPKITEHSELLVSRISHTIGEMLLNAHKEFFEKYQVATKVTLRDKLTTYYYKKNHITDGFDKICDEIANQVSIYQFDSETPDFDRAVRVSLDKNHYFKKIWPILSVETATSILAVWQEILVMLGILGTFTGFYIAFRSGGNLELGVSIAVISSIVGMASGLVFTIVEKSLPDDEIQLGSVDYIVDALADLWDKGKYHAEGRLYITSQQEVKAPETDGTVQESVQVVEVSKETSIQLPEKDLIALGLCGLTVIHAVGGVDGSIDFDEEAAAREKVISLTSDPDPLTRVVYTYLLNNWKELQLNLSQSIRNPSYYIQEAIKSIEGIEQHDTSELRDSFFHLGIAIANASEAQLGDQSNVDESESAVLAGLAILLQTDVGALKEVYPKILDQVNELLTSLADASVAA